MNTGEYFSLTNSRPQFTETVILIAVMDGELDIAEDLIKDMLPGERRIFAEQLWMAFDLVWRQSTTTEEST